jgi:hypothetical protein
MKIDEFPTMLNIKADGILSRLNPQNTKYSLNNKYEYNRFRSWRYLRIWV